MPKFKKSKVYQVARKKFAYMSKTENAPSDDVRNKK